MFQNCGVFSAVFFARSHTLWITSKMCPIDKKRPQGKGETLRPKRRNLFMENSEKLRLSEPVSYRI